MDMGISQNLGISYGSETSTLKKAAGENTAAATETTETSAAAQTETPAASFEKSKETALDTSKQLYKPDTDLVQKLKAEAEARTTQLRNLVEQMLTKQGMAFTESTNMWQMLREGKLEVDPETAAQAKEDVAEDGYWGVTQTSDRLVSFAKALTGGDPGKADEMIEAFKKGYEQATKTWGDELPDICKQTYDATIEKLTAWKDSIEQENAQTAEDASKKDSMVMTENVTV